MPKEPLDVAAVIAGCSDIDACERACKAGSPGACIEAGRLHEFGQGVLRDPARAFTFYERACELGDAGGCFNTAFLLELGRGVPKDARRADDLYRQVCRMGSSTGCRRAEELSASLRP